MGNSHGVPAAAGGKKKGGGKSSSKGSGAGAGAGAAGAASAPEPADFAEGRVVALNVPGGAEGRWRRAAERQKRSCDEDLGVSVCMQDSDGFQLVLVGGDAKKVGEARAKIDAAIASDLDAKSGEFLTPEAIVEVRVNVPGPKQSRIVGQKGATVRGMQAEHACTIEVPKRDEDSTAVIIQGPKAAADAAKKAVLAAAGIDDDGKGGKAKEVAPVPSVDAFFDRVSLVGPKGADIHEALFFPDDEEGSRHARFLQYLRSATRTLDVCVFTITDDRVADILVLLSRAGVKVRVITDDDQSEALGSDIERFAEVGIPVLMDRTKAHMHHKFAVIDGAVLITGSFNWTVAASAENFEDIVITSQADLVSAFGSEFEKLFADKERFQDFKPSGKKGKGGGRR